ncbi:MAG: hypothetical protein PVJ43_00760 [Gemmatimonadales bacterium]
MLGIYILAAMLGGGLLLFSVISGAFHGVGDVDATGADISGVDADLSGVDADVSGGDIHVGGVDADHDVHVGHDTPGLLVLGLFRPRNLIFCLAAFGLTGTFLTVMGNAPDATLTLSLVMGGGAWLLTYGVFTWLRRTDSGVDAVSEREIEGRAARVVLPMAPGEPGRIVCLVADRELYLTARPAPDVARALEAGSEVVILRIEGGVAEIIPFDALELPSGES